MVGVIVLEVDAAASGEMWQQLRWPGRYDGAACMAAEMGGLVNVFSTASGRARGSQWRTRAIRADANFA
jgi:hypothetical protein